MCNETNEVTLFHNPIWSESTARNTKTFFSSLLKIIKKNDLKIATMVLLHILPSWPLVLLCLTDVLLVFCLLLTRIRSATGEMNAEMR